MFRFRKGIGALARRARRENKRRHGAFCLGYWKGSK